MKCNITAAMAACAIIIAIGFSGPVQAGTCQPVKAKGVAPTQAQATLFAQADLKQTAKSMKGKATQAKTKCGKLFSDFHCTIDAVVCPK